MSLAAWWDPAPETCGPPAPGPRTAPCPRVGGSNPPARGLGGGAVVEQGFLHRLGGLGSQLRDLRLLGGLRCLDLRGLGELLRVVDAPPGETAVVRGEVDEVRAAAEGLRHHARRAGPA